MSVQLNDSQSVAIQQIPEEKLKLLKSTICRGASNDELELFLHACNRTLLDPFMRQIYFVKMGGQMTIQTGIDGYRLIAERTKKYMPGRDTTYVYDKAGKLFSATSYIKKLGPDNQWHEIAATAMFTEYYGTGPLWKSKPHVMLAKCSEALCLRKGFPADLSGVYTSEEMEKEIEIKPVQKESEISEAIISEDQLNEINTLLADEDANYKLDLLKYFSNVRRLTVPMTDFSTLPIKNYPALMESIFRRRDNRLKQSMKVQEQISEENE